MTSLTGENGTNSIVPSTNTTAGTTNATLAPEQQFFHQLQEKFGTKYNIVDHDGKILLAADGQAAGNYEYSPSSVTTSPAPIDHNSPSSVTASPAPIDHNSPSPEVANLQKLYGSRYDYVDKVGNLLAKASGTPTGKFIVEDTPTLAPTPILTPAPVPTPALSPTQAPTPTLAPTTSLKPISPVHAPTPSSDHKLTFGEKVVNGIVSVAKAVGNAVLNTFKAPFVATAHLINGTINAVKAFTKPIVNLIPKPIRTFVERAAAPIVKVVNKIGNFFKKLFHF